MAPRRLSFPLLARWRPTGGVFPGSFLWRLCARGFFLRLSGCCFRGGTFFCGLAGFLCRQSLFRDPAAAAGRGIRSRGLAERAPVDVLLRLQIGGKRDASEKAALAVFDIVRIVGRLPPRGRFTWLARIPQGQGLGLGSRLHLVTERIVIENFECFD